jgi:hypothetical protein
MYLSTLAHIDSPTNSLAETRVSIYSQIGLVPNNILARLDVAGKHMINTGYYQMLEQTQHDDMQFIYAVVSQGNSPIGLLYFQVVRFTGSNLLAYFPTIASVGIGGYIQRVGVAIGRRLVNLVDVPMLITGNIFITGDMGMSYVIDLSLAQQSEYLSLAIAHIQQQQPDIRTVLLPGMYEPDGDFDKVFLAKSYRRIYMEPDLNMTLPTDWSSFDDYVSALSSKYRVRVKKILQQCNNVVIKDMTIADVQSAAPKMYELYKQVADKAAFNIAKYKESNFLLQKQLTPDSYTILGFYIDEEMVGFMTMIIHPYKTEVHYCGIDYQRMGVIPIYQRMLYEVIRYAIDNKINKLHFGRTAPEVKSTIGAIPLPMYGYLRYKNNLVNYLMQLFTTRLKPRVYVLRNPFK